MIPALAFYLFAAILCVTEVLDLDLISAAGRDHHIIKLFRFLYFSDRANGGFGLSLIETAARKFHILDL